MDIKRFGQRLKELRGNKSQADIVDMMTKKAGVSTTAQTLGRYERGERKPDLEIIEALSITFNVSADYLLCRSDVKSKDIDLKAACNYTMLSEQTVKVLKAFSELDNLINNKQMNCSCMDILNILLESIGEKAPTLLNLVNLCNFDNTRIKAEEKGNSAIDDFNKNFPAAQKWLDGKLFLLERNEYFEIFRKIVCQEWNSLINTIVQRVNPSEIEKENNLQPYVSSQESIFAHVELEKTIQKIKAENHNTDTCN